MDIEEQKKELIEKINGLTDALASGVFKIHHRGKTIEYHTPSEMRKTLTMLQNELADLTGTSRTIFKRGGFYRD